MGKNYPFSWEHNVITPYVNSFLTASSVAVSSSLENFIAKLSEHDGAFSTVSNFRPETLSYIAGSFIILFSEIFLREGHHMYL